MLKNDLSIEQQLAVELDRSSDIEKLIILQEHKINTYQGKIRKVEEEFEGGLYTLEEDKLRKQKSQEAINTAQLEINTLKEQLNAGGFTPDAVKSLRLELKSLQNRNMAEASFEERLDLVARLGIKVYPSEDLKSRRIKRGMSLREIQETGEQVGFAKVVYGRPYKSRSCDTLIKRYKRFVPESNT